MTIVCETERLTVRHLEHRDADFIVRLLNDPSFLRYIGDKQVRDRDDAVRYLEEGPLSSYQTWGFGLSMVALKESGEPIGICGFLKRDELELPDLGFAFLPQYWGEGYACEAAEALLQKGLPDSAFKTVQAVTLTDNQPSNRLLLKLGFEHVATIELYGAQNNLYEFHLDEH